MLPRNSKNKGNHSSSSSYDIKIEIQTYAALTKYQIQEKFDTLFAALQALKGEEMDINIQRLRSIMHVMNFYPVLENAMKKDIFFTSLDRKNLLIKMGVSANSVAGYLDDFYHIGKVMQRYKLDFDKAFDFWVMNNLLRDEFKYHSAGDKSYPNFKDIYDFSDQITLAKLLELGKKAGFSEKQVRDIIPALSTKMMVSETKDLTYKHRNNLFANTGELSNKMTEVVKKHEQRLANCR